MSTITRPKIEKLNLHSNPVRLPDGKTVGTRSSKTSPWFPSLRVRNYSKKWSQLCYQWQLDILHSNDHGYYYMPNMYAVQRTNSSNLDGNQQSNICKPINIYCTSFRSIHQFSCVRKASCILSLGGLLPPTMSSRSISTQNNQFMSAIALYNVCEVD